MTDLRKKHKRSAAEERQDIIAWLTKRADELTATGFIIEANMYCEAVEHFERGAHVGAHERYRPPRLGER